MVPINIFLPSDPQKRQAVRVEAAAARLAKKIDVEAQKTSDVIDVKYGKAGDPETPACVLQTLSKLYLEKHLQLQRPAGTSDFFTQETEKYREALADSEAKLAEFSRTAGVAAPDILRTDMAGQVATSEAALYQAKQLIAADEKRIDEHRPADGGDTRTIVNDRTIDGFQPTDAKPPSVASGGEDKTERTAYEVRPSVSAGQEADQEIEDTDSQSRKRGEVKVRQSARPIAIRRTNSCVRINAKTHADLASEQATAAALVNSIKRNARGNGFPRYRTQ